MYDCIPKDYTNPRNFFNVPCPNCNTNNLVHNRRWGKHFDFKCSGCNYRTASYFLLQRTGKNCSGHDRSYLIYLEDELVKDGDNLRFIPKSGTSSGEEMANFIIAALQVIVNKFKKKRKLDSKTINILQDLKYNPQTPMPKDLWIKQNIYLFKNIVKIIPDGRWPRVKKIDHTLLDYEMNPKDRWNFTTYIDELVQEANKAIAGYYIRKFLNIKNKTIHDIWRI